MRLKETKERERLLVKRTKLEDTAEHFGVSRDIGSIAPSKCADILVLDNLSKVSTNTVVADGLVELGCTLASLFMTMSLLALPVLPELRITDKGLVDTQRFQLVSLLFS